MEDKDIARLVQEFEAGTLPRASWTHGAHLLVALWYLMRLPEGEATDAIRRGIQAYNRTCGIAQTPTGGYHETITRFYAWAVARHLRACPADTPLADLADGLLQTWGDKRLLGRYYSRPLLMSWEARTGWIEPDLHPLDEAVGGSTHSLPSQCRRPRRCQTAADLS